MAKFDGGLADLDFASTTYECITQSSMTGTASDNTAECSSSSGPVTHRVAGTPAYTVTADFLLDSGSAGTTVLTAFTPGSSGALDYYPEGNASTKTKIAFTNAFVTNCTVGNSTSSFTTVSVTFGCDGAVTYSTVA